MYNINIQYINYGIHLFSHAQNSLFHFLYIVTHVYTHFLLLPYTIYNMLNRLAQLFEPVLNTGPNISHDVNFVVLSHL